MTYSRRFYRALRKNRLILLGGSIVSIITVIAILAPYIAPYSPTDMQLSQRFEFWSPEHLFGTDKYGRDVLSRVVYGARYSLYIGFLSVLISASVGVVLGLLAGYYEATQSAIMRVTDLALAFPDIMLALVLIAIFGPGLYNVILAISLFQIPQFIRLTNSFTVLLKRRDFIEAAEAIGMNGFRVLRKHILPNCLAPLVIQATLFLPSAILTASGLSFIGLGVQPPTPEWGLMINLGREYMRQAPNVVLYPGLALMLVVMGFNFLGDGLREIMDPKLKRRM